MGQPIRTSPFAPNVFIVNHKRRHKFVSTAKAGCTTLKYVTAIDDKLYKFKRKDKVQSVHDKMGYRPNGESLIPIDSAEFPDYTSVAVWRDPVKRFMSWYRDKVLHPYQPYIVYSGLAHDNSIDRCLTFLEFELSKSDPEWIDEHVRPHSSYFKSDQIDVLVDLKDLSSYLQSIGVEANEPTNKAKKADGPTQSQIKRLKELYKADYELHKAMKTKIWTP